MTKKWKDCKNIKSKTTKHTTKEVKEIVKNYTCISQPKKTFYKANKV